MIELFISTATSRLVFSIIRDNNIIYNYNQIENNSLSEKIMSIVEEGIIKTKINLKDVNAIYVVNGPGSFTGIRVGVTFAKVLALCIGCKILPISTLEMYASTDVSTDYVLSLIDARRGYAYVGLYDKNLNRIIDDKYIDLKALKCDYKYTIITDDNFDNALLPDINVLKLLNKHRDDKKISSHLINPNYLKNTEAEESLKNGN